VAIKQYRRYAEMPQPEVVTRNDERFARLRSRLPAHGVVGYVGAKELIEEYDVNPYFMAQYALCPAILSRRPDQPLDVGNFGPSDPRPTGEELRVIEDFGDGVLLYRRDSK
jgi:hypothetical protein